MLRRHRGTGEPIHVGEHPRGLGAAHVPGEYRSIGGSIKFGHPTTAAAWGWLIVNRIMREATVVEVPPSLDWIAWQPDLGKCAQGRQLPHPWAHCLAGRVLHPV